MKRIILIVPAFNEAENILKTVDSIRKYKAENDIILDYIVINDGSTDDTARICDENGIKHIDHPSNRGIGCAVRSGYIYAAKNEYDIAVQFDGDGQHDINSLARLIAPIEAGKADFSVGSRFAGGKSSFRSTFARRIGIRYLSLLIRTVCGLKITDPTSGFRAANRAVTEYFAQNYPVKYPEPESAVRAYKKGFRISEVQVNMFARTGGRSSIRGAFKSVGYMIRETSDIIKAAKAKP